MLYPESKMDWRDYFSRDELEKNFKMIEQGGDPNDQESDYDSDSQGGADIYQDGEFPAD